MRELDVRPDRGLQADTGNAVAALLEDDTSGPLQLGAMLIGGLAIAFIVVNAAFLQSEPHPAPMFQTRSEGVILTGNTPAKPSVKSTARIPINPAQAESVSKVELIQSLLQKQGYDIGDIDGVFGMRTQTAIMAFERDRGYPETGRVTPLLLKRLKRPQSNTAPKPLTAPSAATPKVEAPASSAIPVAPVRSASLKSTANRDEILLVQNTLSDLGYGPIEADGVLGSQTSQAIQRFELDRGLPITGNIGDRIIAELVLIGGVNPVAQR